MAGLLHTLTLVNWNSEYSTRYNATLIYFDIQHFINKYMLFTVWFQFAEQYINLVYTIHYTVSEAGQNVPNLAGHSAAWPQGKRCLICTTFQPGRQLYTDKKHFKKKWKNSISIFNIWRAGCLRYNVQWNYNESLVKMFEM